MQSYTTLSFIRLHYFIFPATYFGPICKTIFRLKFEKVECTINNSFNLRDLVLLESKGKVIPLEARLWIGHILRRNCLLQRVIEGKIKGGIEVTGRRERRCRKLPDDLKERRGYSHLKEEALDRTMWRASFGRGFEPLVRQTTK